jgi:mRNA-degrading endonuclease HigB of HigAB toxin-antitoxin module
VKTPSLNELQKNNKNNLKGVWEVIQSQALSPTLFKFVLKYDIRKVQENRMVLELNGTHQVLMMLVYLGGKKT